MKREKREGTQKRVGKNACYGINNIFSLPRVPQIDFIGIEQQIDIISIIINFILHLAKQAQLGQKRA